MTYGTPINILRGHLEEIYEALSAASGYHSADDLARQYKNVGGTFRPSNLTKRLDSARERVNGYLAQEDSDEPVSEG